MKTVKVENTPIEKIRRGIDTLANTVRETLGPSGKNILIDMGVGHPPMSTRDGVTVAHYITLKDRLEDFGASLVKQAARNTNNEGGDGTTTATVLAQAIFSEGLKFLSAGHSPIKVKRDIDSAVERAVERLKGISRDVSGNIKDVATISANNDPALGEIISEAITRVGKTGSILVEASTKNKTYVSFQEGTIVERGWGEISHYLINNLAKRTIEYDNPEILITKDNINTFSQLENVLKYVAKNKRPLILVVRDINDSMLAWIVANKLKGGLPLAVIKTPGYNDNESIDDLSCRVGARHYNSDWSPLSDFKPEDLGHAEKIIIRQSDTTIIQGCGDISDRLADLNEQIKNEEDTIAKARLQDRLNRLTSAVATINVFANSETEMKDLKLRIEDAINATRHALEEGVVQGGGTALLRIRGEENTPGDKILNQALEMPFRYIVSNTGENPDKILAEVEKAGGTTGYDANNKKMCDLIEAGIIDPVKVTRTALQKAASVATMLLITGSCIVDEGDE